MRQGTFDPKETFGSSHEQPSAPRQNLVALAFRGDASRLEKQTMKHLMAVFLANFIAEPGDKTPLATVVFATARQIHPILIFLAASAALVRQ